MSYQMISHPIILSYQVASPHIPTYSIVFVSSSIISYPIISHQTTTYQTTVIIIGSFREYNHNLYDWKLPRCQSLLLISKAHKLRIKVIN